MNPVARFSSMNLHRAASSSWERSRWGERRGSAFVQCDFEIVGSMVKLLASL